MSKPPIEIIDWFDPTNPEHLKTWREVRSKKAWPKLPTHVYYGYPGWPDLIDQKILDYSISLLNTPKAEEHPWISFPDAEGAWWVHCDVDKVKNVEQDWGVSSTVSSFGFANPRPCCVNFTGTLSLGPGISIGTNIFDPEWRQGDLAFAQRCHLKFKRIPPTALPT